MTYAKSTWSSWSPSSSLASMIFSRGTRSAPPTRCSLRRRSVSLTARTPHRVRRLRRATRPCRARGAASRLARTDLASAPVSAVRIALEKVSCDAVERREGSRSPDRFDATASRRAMRPAGWRRASSGTSVAEGTLGFSAAASAPGRGSSYRRRYESDVAIFVGDFALKWFRRSGGRGEPSRATPTSSRRWSTSCGAGRSRASARPWLPFRRASVRSASRRSTSR